MPKNYLTSIPVTYILPRDVQIEEDKNIILTGITQSGKTAIIFDYLNNLEKKFIYIDFDILQNIENSLNRISEIVERDNIKIVIFDIYDLQIEKYLPLFLDRNLQIIIISWNRLNTINFKQTHIFPLNFEEFISFKSGIENIELSFLRYSKTGGFPIFAKYSDDFLFKHLKRLLYFALSDFEIDILKNIAENSGNARTVLNIYISLKEKRKISKDKLYKSVEKLIEIGYIISVQEFQKHINKKYYLIDHGLQNSFETEKNFSKLFENMVISEIWKRGKTGQFYRGIDLFLKEDRVAILSLPFIEIETLKKRIFKTIKDFKKLGVKKIEIITMDLEINFKFQGIDVEVIKFMRWALLN